MSRYLAPFILCLAVTSVQAPGLIAQNNSSSAPALAAETQWLALVDSEHYAQSWTTAAPMFRKAVSQPDWSQALNLTRRPLGEVRSRKLKASQPATMVPGAPDGHYLIVEYTTSFAAKADATEQVTAEQEPDGSWHVAGYFIH